MRYAVAAGTLRGAGSALVGQQVLSRLVRDYPGDEITAWTPRDSPTAAEWNRLGAPEAQLHIRVGRPGMIGKFLDEAVGIPTACRRTSCSALFSMGDTGCPRPGIPHLLLVQQAYLAAPKDHLDFQMPPAFRAKIHLMESYFALGLGGVGRLTVQTRFMAAWLARRWDIEPSRISIVPSAPAPAAVSRTCVPLRDPMPYVVYLSSGGPHKNHTVIPRILSHLKQGGVPIRCVLTVSEREVSVAARLADQLEVRDLVEFHGGVSRLAAADLLAGAVALVTPSKLESFGLGLLEAMAMGCPVVAADRPYAREACGQAGLYADADDALGFASHIASLLSSGSHWEDRSQACKVRFGEVGSTWEDAASQYRAILQEMTGSKA